MDTPDARSFRDQTLRLIIGIIAPLAIVGLAFALWSISDRAGYIGPLDKATFGWISVIPLWIAAPVVAGFAWRHLSSRGSVGVALGVWGVVAITASVLLWQAVVYPDCDFGANVTPLEWVIPSTLIGALIGAGPALGGLVVSFLLRQGQRWRAIIFGAALELTLVFGTIVVSGMTIMSMPACQRP